MPFCGWLKLLIGSVQRLIMKIFDRYCEPYAEYCVRTTLSEEELKKAVKEECPAKWDTLSWKVIKSSLYLSKESVFLYDPDDPLKLYSCRSGRNGLQGEISIQCEKCSTGTILHIKIAPDRFAKTFAILWITAALLGGSSFPFLSGGEFSLYSFISDVSLLLQNSAVQPQLKKSRRSGRNLLIC